MRILALLASFLLINFSSFAQQSKTKSLEELVDNKVAGWKIVNGLIKEAKNKVEVLPKDKKKAEAALVESQLSTQLPLGAVIYETGGILVDAGWIRIVGSGSSKLNRSLLQWNKGKSFKQTGQQPSFLLVADDVVGGFFAINNGAFGRDEIGKIFYFAPDIKEWESFGLNYPEFLDFCFSGDLEGFYNNLRWNGWKNDLKQIDGNKAFIFSPSLSSVGGNINKVTKKIVPVEEVWKSYFEESK